MLRSRNKGQTILPEENKWKKADVAQFKCMTFELTTSESKQSSFQIARDDVFVHNARQLVPIQTLI